MSNEYKKILFGGGCFWGVQHYFNKVIGVVNSSVGYANGKTKNPTYEQVCKENTGHVEVCKVEYDPNFTKLKYLLEHFVTICDTSTLNRQGNDIGTQYRSGIYYFDDSDKKEIIEFFEGYKKKNVKQFVTEIIKVENYWDAEEYHQDYLEKNPSGYCHINPIKYKNVENLDKLLRSGAKF